METHHIILVNIGVKLTQLRKKSGHHSYESFALENNLSRMQYWRIEKGKTNLTIKSLSKILAIHKMTIEEFFKKDAF
ncbi:MAG: helix-turn-helix transcriptional regulator [Bacteroidetes bacterium]|nr:helix-turn-helix transcriptional regulator [Bacteroidota bacterium]